MIAAGSTGSMPATAELIATIARLPHGAVVLPGLDTDLDPETWDLIGGRRDAAGRQLIPPAVGHPQFALRALLGRIGIARDEVVALGDAAAHGRERTVSEALRPAAATDRWRQLAGADFPARTGAALETLSVVEAANAEEEALAIAVVLREAIEVPEKTAALVTPDRALARRVLAALERWQIAVDDSGGDALPDTPAGLFARLAAEAALGGLAPVTLLALLKHPLTRLGAAKGANTRAVAALETSDVARPAPEAGKRRPFACARDVSRAAGQASAWPAIRSSSVRSARLPERRRARGRGRAARAACGRDRTAGNALGCAAHLRGTRRTTLRRHHRLEQGRTRPARGVRRP